MLGYALDIQSVRQSFHEFFTSSPNVDWVSSETLAMTTHVNGQEPGSIEVEFDEAVFLAHLDDYITAARRIGSYRDPLEGVWGLIDTYLMEAIGTCAPTTSKLVLREYCFWPDTRAF